MRFFCPKCPGECVPVGDADERVQCIRCGRVDDATHLVRLGQFIARAF